jgi:hypothetical protein
MRLILGGINGHYLRNITENCAGQTEEVVAAVAYAMDDSLLFEWCWRHQISLRFYGRLDPAVAVSTAILKGFLKKQSPTHVCRLVQHHHAKVIWWRGAGMYIGSANLTHSAWHKNVEAGCFFPEEEIGDDMAADIQKMFAVLHERSTPLTEELVRALESREREFAPIEASEKDFWGNPSLITWPGLVQAAPQGAMARRRQEFLAEWHATLQQIRDIGAIISQPENRPAWIDAHCPPLAQADQFLHAHYYQRTFEDGRANYEAFFEQNRTRPQEALDEAVQWWRQLPEAPEREDEMLNIAVPYLHAALSQTSIQNMTYEAFRDICEKVHAIRDYSRRVSNHAVGLPSSRAYTIEDKVEALSSRIWSDQSEEGMNVSDLLLHLLYGGSPDQVPERLWQAIAEPRWKIDGLGISALGELVGWALPDRFPPRNGRTSKSLRSLGYDVTVHV